MVFLYFWKRCLTCWCVDGNLCLMDSVFQVGTGITNTLINIRKFFDKSYAMEAEDVPVLATSIGYGVYMSVSSNLRYCTSSLPCVRSRLITIWFFVFKHLAYKHKFHLFILLFYCCFYKCFLNSSFVYIIWIRIQMFMLER